MTPTSKSAGESVAEVRGGTPLPIGAQLGDFEVTGVIHESESSVGYVAADRSSMGEVAIKEYLPARLAERMANGNVGVRSLRHEQAFRDGMQRFLSEARMLAALDEPALIEVLRSWEQNGTAYMAMPLYEGRTLKDVLRDSPKPSEAWLKTMFGPLLDALATLHRSGRCPCDVTPDNIVVLTDGTPLFIGSGAAPHIAASTTEDITGVLNSGFVAIERYAYDPSMPEGPWTDIYAVAAVLHLAITGKPPPAPTTRMVADTMPPISDVTSDYSKLFLDALDRGLAVRPTHRPQTIAEFRAALGIFSMASGAMPVGRPVPSPPAPDPQNVSRVPEPGPIPRISAQERARALGDGSKMTPPPSSAAEQRSPHPPSQTLAGSRLSSAPWKLAVTMSLIVVGLAGLGLLAWNFAGPRQTPPRTADTGSLMKPAPTTAQSSPPAAVSTPPSRTATSPGTPDKDSRAPDLSTKIAAPDYESRPSSSLPAAPVLDRQADVAASMPDSNLVATPKTTVAGTASPERATSDVVPVTPVPGGTAASAVPTPPTPRTGKIQFSIKPWGEIVVDGKTRGVSPPIKELPIPQGRHRIEIRNSTLPAYSSEVNVKAGSRVSIAHTFESP